MREDVQDSFLFAIRRLLASKNYDKNDAYLCKMNSFDTGDRKK